LSKRIAIAYYSLNPAALLDFGPCQGAQAFNIWQEGAGGTVDGLHQAAFPC
jgi:hypothetical protein